MEPIHRQPRISNRRHIQIYLDPELHALVVKRARQQNISWSMAARQLMAQGLQSIPTTNDSESNGYRAA